MTRPICPRCKGVGKVQSPAFNKSLGAHVRRSCHICCGKGTLQVMVDLYDVVEWLVARDQKLTARLIEKQFGAPNEGGDT